MTNAGRHPGTRSSESPASMLDMGPVDTLCLLDPSLASSPQICRESLWFGENLLFLLHDHQPDTVSILLAKYLTESGS
jgi:hypothetical protein